jgi:hypothetical protein
LRILGGTDAGIGGSFGSVSVRINQILRKAPGFEKVKIKRALTLSGPILDFFR